MTQAKIEGKFYPLQNDEWLSVAKKLTHSELLVLYHLRTLEPFGDKLTESSTKDVAEATGISQRSVQRALIKLADLELIDLQIQKFAFKLRSQAVISDSDVATIMTIGDSAVASTSAVSRQSQPCRAKVTAVANSSPLSDSIAETVATQGFESSKTLKTYSDLLKTLSEGMRESFEKFCLKKIEECSFKIGSRKAWLNKHGVEYLEEFKEMYSEALSNPERIAPKAELAPPDITTLKKMYGENWESAASYFGLISPNSSTVENEEVIEW
jgi:DNA-binding transcriptional ArsR family regulator